jgi:5'-nucleotidase
MMERKNRPLILISNDDGVNAKGIRELIETLRDVAELVVMAPDGPRSGAACAITSEYPVRPTLLVEEEGLKIYRCNGMPVDCVKLAMYMLGKRPDLVIGGINHGDNSSVNVHYSGTMGVVIEGCLKGIPAIGFSLCDHDADADFGPMIPYVRRITEEVLAKGLPKGTCLNVNVPKTSELQGVRICRQTDASWGSEWARGQHPKGGEYFWLTGKFTNNEPEAQDADRWALEHGYVAITPIQIDMTAYALINELKTWDLNV